MHSYKTSMLDIYVNNFCAGLCRADIPGETKWFILSGDWNYQSFEKPQTYKMQYKLPTNIKCEEGCVLQWWWHTLNSCVIDCDPKVCGFYSEGRNDIIHQSSLPKCPSEDPDGNSEVFANCADIRITDGNVNSEFKPSSPPSPGAQQAPSSPAAPEPKPPQPSSPDPVPDFVVCGEVDTVCCEEAPACDGDLVCMDAEAGVDAKEKTGDGTVCTNPSGDNTNGKPSSQPSYTPSGPEFIVCGVVGTVCCDEAPPCDDDLTCMDAITGAGAGERTGDGTMCAKTAGADTTGTPASNHAPAPAPTPSPQATPSPMPPSKPTDTSPAPAAYPTNAPVPAPQPSDSPGPDSVVCGLVGTVCCEEAPPCDDGLTCTDAETGTELKQDSGDGTVCIKTAGAPTVGKPESTPAPHSTPGPLPTSKPTDMSPAPTEQPTQASTPQPSFNPPGPDSIFCGEDGTVCCDEEAPPCDDGLTCMDAKTGAKAGEKTGDGTVCAKTAGADPTDKPASTPAPQATPAPVTPVKPTEKAPEPTPQPNPSPTPAQEPTDKSPTPTSTPEPAPQPSSNSPGPDSVFCGEVGTVCCDEEAPPCDDGLTCMDAKTGAKAEEKTGDGTVCAKTAGADPTGTPASTPAPQATPAPVTPALQPAQAPTPPSQPAEKTPSPRLPNPALKPAATPQGTPKPTSKPSSAAPSGKSTPSSYDCSARSCSTYWGRQHCYNFCMRSRQTFQRQPPKR
jgi:hypothetical protein